LTICRARLDDLPSAVDPLVELRIFHPCQYDEQSGKLILRAQMAQLHDGGDGGRRDDDEGTDGSERA
jgi:hypothetical protein